MKSPEKLPHYVKSVNTNRRTSLIRDAKFVRDIKQLMDLDAGFEERNVSGTIVTPIKAEDVSSPLHVKSSALIVSSGSKTTAPTASPSKKYHYPSGWHHYSEFESKRTFKKPAQWRDTTSSLRSLYYHLSLAEFGQVYSFTVNLSAEVEAKARAEVDDTDWLYRRLARALKKSSKPTKAIFVVFEENEKGRLHCHGEIEASANEIDIVREAFREAAGEWPFGRQFQTHTEAAPNEGWLNYSIKNSWKTSRYMRNLTKNSKLFSVSFKGKDLFANSALRAKARSLYEEHCKRVVKLCP